MPNRLTSRALSAVLGYRCLDLSDAQEGGDACVLCGHAFAATEERGRYGRDLCHRRALYRCDHPCILESAEGLAQAFTRALAARGGDNAWTYYLGLDDDPDPGWLAAQPLAVVTVSDQDAAARSVPLAHAYAERLSAQAARLHLAARITAHHTGTPATATKT